MLTKDQVFDFLFNWLKTESGGLTVVRSPQPLGTNGQKAPRPARPYASLRFLSASSKLSISVDQQSVTESTYPASGVWRMTLDALGGSDSITIMGVTFTPTVKDSIDDEIQEFINYFRSINPLLIFVLVSEGCFDVYRNDGSNLVEPTATGDWTIVSSPSQGQPLYTVSTEGMRKAVATINIFGDDAVSILAQVRDSLDRPDVIDNFAAAGISHISESSIEDLTELQETIYEERGHMDLTVGFVYSSEVNVSTIEKIALTGTTRGGASDGREVSETVNTDS